MRTIRTLIVDDEAPARRRMKKLLQARHEFELIAEAERGAEAIQKVRFSKPDLILLDIQLKDMTGFEVLQAVATTPVKVIFITAYDTYAIQAFEENAIDYLLKPYKDERFHEALDRVGRQPIPLERKAFEGLLQNLQYPEVASKLSIHEGKTTHLIEAKKLHYIKSDTYYCQFYFEDHSSKVIRISLKRLEELLPDQFLRINKSIIINRDEILSIRELKRTIEVTLPNDVCFSFDADKFQNMHDRLQ